MKRLFKQIGQSRLPQVHGRIYLPTLKHPVTIHRDKWGIPHLTAHNRHDLFLAQGFTQAQDRMWQMELNRRAALGTLSAIFGPITLNTDRLTRTLGFHRLAHESLNHLDDTTRADLIAYTKGINAWLQSQPALPLEFSLIQHQPEPWHPVHTLAYGRLQMWALTTGASSEWVQAQLSQKLGTDKAASLDLNYPKNNPITLTSGIEVTGLTVNGLTGSWTHPFLGKGTLDGANRGSNGWVIGPERSQSGHAILCNDMHLPVGTPSLWYTMHLHSQDGLHVAGFTQPGLPYVLVGHTDKIAWGATLAYTDCEDLFAERLHPNNPALYEFAGEWREATIYQEQIEVRGLKNKKETITCTHHGPLVNGTLVEAEVPLAFSSMALRPEATITGFRLLNEAQNWDDFVTAVAHIQSPALNLLYADTDDNIGHYVSGSVPIRAQGDGTTPAPGWAGTHEWIGTVPFTEMPHALNPKQGFLVSANHKIVSDDFPHFLGKVWRNGYRAKRIEQLLTAQSKISVADCQRFHLDLLCLPGLELVQLVSQICQTVSLSAEANVALAWLEGWNGRLDPESVGGTVYQVLVRQLSEAILAPHLDNVLRSKALGLGDHPLMQPVNEFQGQWLVSLLSILSEVSELWNLDHALLLEDCLARTTAVCRQKLGDDPNEWQWGKLHQITFAHAFGLVPGLSNLFNQGPFAIGGDENTVAQASIRPDLPYDNNAISVSSRFIVDMGHIDQALAMHAPGQSGHVGSPHYGDLIDPWLNGGYYPLTWTQEATTAVAVGTLKLHPHL